MSESDRIRLLHMRDAAREALSFVAGRRRNEVFEDRRAVLALIKELEIIGEAANKISPELKGRHADIPWAAMAGMRNRLIHAYAAIDLDVVWSAVTLELPKLARRVEEILDAEAIDF